MIDVRSRIRGSLLGGAVGDALGAPVEFLSLEEIRARVGEDGVGEMPGTPEWQPRDWESPWPPGAVTDDTQLTLFTAEGLLRARRAREAGSAVPLVTTVHHAYLRWLGTQGFAVPDVGDAPPAGWLAGQPVLRHRRGPGMTTVSALGSGEVGTTAEPLNDSKGCGGIMRMAPVGLLLPAEDDPFALGCELGALTHGHPTAWLASGALAHMVARLLEGDEPRPAAEDTLRRLTREAGHDECSGAITSALRAAREGPATAATVTSLGEGWVGHETLAIAVYCAVACEGDVELGLRLAVNHSGDSDSTGAVAGNVIGAWLGEEAIPERWSSAVEARDVISTVADDLVAARRGEAIDPERYPAG